ncbi:ankyrin repeat domain protein [Nitzschia inconspicua]|uniref:Ankyrin repeat domain protein n=1 Tax=Nitzschia inconspicua TaxID=303405 RepID=A0A9K3K7V3_9STRA|nr:ankyrin repeat domain protein [Nitzschia inconspicua]KAG7367076.1 ankyrin repeat domain protein [Nitzschia inconspicua]
MAAPEHRRSRSITSLLSVAGHEEENQGPTVLNVLVSAWQVRWRTVEERLSTHPRETRVLDSGGCSVLYRVLARRHDDYPPVRIVRKIVDSYPNAAWERYGGVTLLEIACRNGASLETLDILTQTRPSVPEDATALSALWRMYCDSYGDEETFLQFLKSGSAEAFLVGCKFQLILRYITTEKMLPFSLERALCSSQCSIDLFKHLCCVLGPSDPQQPKSLGNDENEESFVRSFEAAAIEDRRLLSAKLEYLASQKKDGSIGFDHIGVDGRLVLHVAFEHNIASDNIVKLLSNDFDCRILTKRHGKTGLFPVQMAVSCEASTSCVYSMLRSAPCVLGGVQQFVPIQESCERLPASIDTSNLAVWISPVFEQLLKSLDSNLHSQFTTMLRSRTKDPAWNQMIGAANAFPCPPKLMELLITLHPEMLHQPDRRGWLPLHHAITSQRGDDVQIASMLLNAYPAACHHRDVYGCLPFHLACSSGKGVQLLEMILEHNPHALEEVDRTFQLPAVLLAAQSRRASLSSIFHLLTRTPNVVARQEMDTE